MDRSAVRQTFTAALDALVADVQRDRSIVAAILCGSLSHDTVWAKSDIDLVLVTIDDKQIQTHGVALNADGVNIHALLMPRAEFRRTVEGAIRNSFFHSFLTKGRLLYTHDPTIADLWASLAEMGKRDREVQLLNAASAALPSIYKAHKWFLTREDLDYTALWILYSATPLAKVEIINAGLLADREVIPQALTLNPAFFKSIYTNLLNTKKTRANVQQALEAVDDYIASRARSLFGALLEYLREIGEARSSSEIEAHFLRNFGIEDVLIACEYLSDQGLLGKASTPVRLTKRSSVAVQELAFYHIDPR